MSSEVKGFKCEVSRDGGHTWQQIEAAPRSPVAWHLGQAKEWRSGDFIYRRLT